MTALALVLLCGGVPVQAEARVEPEAPVQPEAGTLAEVRALLARRDFAAALAAVEEADPAGDDAALSRLRAEALVGLLDYAGAVAALRRARPDPDNLALRARLLAMLGRDEEARATVAELLALDESLPVASRLELAAALREAGLTAVARRVLGPPAAGESPALPGESPALAGESPALALERGRLRVAEDDHEAALPLLEAAASAAEPPAGAAEALGRLLAQLGRRKAAISWLRRAHAAAPRDSAARFRLGQLLAQDPDPVREAEGRRLLRGYEEQRQRERRRALLLAAVQERPVAGGGGVSAAGGEAEGRAAWVELAGLLLDGGDLEEADRVLRAGKARYPADPAFDIGRARLLLLSGDPVGAAEALAPLVPGPAEPLAGASLSAARWLAEARLRGGDPAGAAAVFDRVLDAGGEGLSPRIRAAAATALAMSGAPARALALFDEVLARTRGPARAGPLADSGLVLEMLARPAEAAARYRQSLEADPAHVAAALGLAELLLRDGRAEEAERVVRAALEHAPGDEALRELLARLSPP